MLCVCVARNECPAVCFSGSESHSEGAGEQQVTHFDQTPHTAPRADDGDPGVPAADGQLRSYYGTTLCNGHFGLFCRMSSH